MNKKKKVLKSIFPEALWNDRFIFWWCVSLATVFLFDIFWMMQTTFRPMSYFAFYPVLFLGAFFLSLPSLFLRKGVIQTIWLFFFDALFIANLMYCRTYYNAIPLHSYALMGNLSDFKASVWDSFKWYFAFLPVLTIGAAIFYSIKKSRFTVKNPAVLPWALSVLILCFVTWLSDAFRGGTMKRMDMMANYAYLSSSITPIYSLAGFLYHDYYKANEKLTPQEEQFVADWLKTHQNLSGNSATDTIVTDRKIPKNLIIILCESLESWVIDKKVEGIELTPNLNRWIKDSTSFYAPNVITQVGSGRSIDAQLLLLTGLRPMQNRAYAYDAVENNYFSLPKAFARQNGHSYLLTCDKPYVWNQALVAKAFGIDTLIYSKDFKIDETAGPSRRLSDGSFMRQIADKIKTQQIWPDGEKAFILAVTYSGHNPFNLPKHLRNISFKENYPEIIKDYMITANYTDRSLNSLISYLKSRPDWDETMVVITGDHEGLASDRAPALKNPLSKNFVDSLPHVPFIVLNSPVPGIYKEQLGQADLYATILDLMGMQDYEWKGLGFSVFDNAPKDIATTNAGEIFGNTAGLNDSVVQHIKDATTVSDIILKFNLLNNFSDSGEMD